MSRIVKALSSSLSLRTPQRRSLEILERVTELAKPSRDLDLAATLASIQKEFPEVTDFERPFVNLCFALATGVGKTRLMGAFISYLVQTHGIRHFLVLAPNLTIYRKLVADFTPNTPKYVFQGIDEFALQSPTIITGDNWESGLGIRADSRQGQAQLFEDPVHINIFNNAKFVARGEDKEVRKLRAFRETIGESYFDYLAGLEDLVIIMDEAHRYRADGSMQAIIDLKPVLGIELTATPQVEQGKKKAAKRFANIIYNYGLAEAMNDGFVKQPAVATKEGMDAADARKMDEGTLDRMKLEDGVRLHEATKVELDTFARNTGRVRVKPFMLVIAKDTAHSAELLAYMRSEQFFGGRYADKAIEVNSGQSGAEKDEVIEQLLKVERTDNPIEIVVHVNMLKEGWDVTNLYTIVPLRTADSRTLVEQSIGRGLRLPYGRRVATSDEDAAVDRLTIVAHDRFQEIVDAAREGGYTFSKVIIPASGAPKMRTLTADSRIADVIAATEYKSASERHVAETTIRVIAEEGHSLCVGAGLPPTQASLSDPRVQILLQAAVARRAAATTPMPVPGVPQQGEIVYNTAVATPVVIAAIVEAVTAKYVLYTVSVPRIALVPSDEVTVGFRAFQVETQAIRFAAVSENIVIQNLTATKSGGADFRRFTVGGELEVAGEQRLENYVVRGLINLHEVSYDHHADFLYDIAGQVVAHFRGYLSNDEEVTRVLKVYQQPIVKNLHSQMEKHRWEHAASYTPTVTQGFASANPESFNVPEGVVAVDFRRPVADKREIRNMIFKGFERGYFNLTKFDSDSERRLAVIIDRDENVQAWVKPAKATFSIFYSQDDRYEPDFVVQTKTEKLLLEPKQADQMTNAVVLKKAKAALEWCRHATEFEAGSPDGRPWRYVLIPHDAIIENTTLNSLVRTYEFKG